MPKLTDGPKLTKRTIDAIKPASAEQIHWDPELRGFGLRVYPSGLKVYLIQYRNAAGRTRRLTLGNHGPLTADAARSLAKVRLGEVEKGLDPSADRQRSRRNPTVSQLADRYLDEHARPKKKPSSLATDKRLLRLIILPALGSMKCAAVTRADVAGMHHGHRSTPVQANRAVALLSKMMGLAERWGVRPDGSNPCRNVDKYRETPRNRYLSPAELAQLGQTLRAAESEGIPRRNHLGKVELQREHPSAVLAVRLLIFTGCRRSEILRLTWPEVEAGALRLRDSKTGEKTVPIGPPALELLAKASRAEGNHFVCWGEKPGSPFIGIDKSWRRIKAAAGLDDLRLHDLRHSFASVGAAGGFGLPIIGGLLGHSSPATTHRYSHLSNDPLRQAADRISSEIAAAMQGDDGVVSAFRR